METPQVKKAFLSGFLTNLLNPKCTFFLLSLFAQFLKPDTPLAHQLAYGAIVPLTALSWFTLISCLLTHRILPPFIQRYQRIFTKLMAILLLLLSLYFLYLIYRQS